MRAIATAAALWVGLCTAAAQERPAAEPTPDADQARGSWLTRWWPFGRKEEKPPPAPPKRPAESPKAVRDREESAFLRRSEVCLKLKEIAIRTRDDELIRKAEELEKLAWEVYSRRTAGLPDGGASGADERALTERLTPRGDGRALTERPQGTDRGGVAQRRD